MAGRPHRSIKRIFICSDPLMTKEKEQFSNRRWFRDIIDRPITLATGVKPQSFFSSLTQPGVFDRRKFFGLSGVKVNVGDTQFHYDDEVINTSSLDYFAQYINYKTDLIIGYELSEQTRRIFSRLKITYIDIWLHPVRFLDDILFAFHSNSEKINRELFSFNVSSSTFYLYADRLKVMGYKGWRRQELKVSPRSALFVGQMLNDKSVCRDGKMLSVMDFEPQFAKLAASHEKVFYSRHPYLKKGDEHILQFLNKFPNVELTSLPAYRFLPNSNVKTVMAVSSSVLVEAKYFDKKIITLYRPVIPLANDFSPDSYASIYQEFISPHFWAKILAPLLRPVDNTKVNFIDSKDKLRDMLGFYWSYKEIDKLEEIRNAEVAHKALPNAAKTPKTKPSTFVKKAPGRLFEQTPENLKALTQQIAKSQIISFDVFDTLIERVTAESDDLFKFMELDAFQITAGKVQNFSEIRAKSREWANEKIGDSEEVLLSARYDAIAERLGLNERERQELFERELEIEQRICKARFFGRELFAAAIAANKRIILISDTYFDKEFVEQILKTCGYAGWSALYTSSEYDRLKRNGSLFEIVLSQEGVPARRILHIGDDEISDVKMPSSRGIKAEHVPSVFKIFRDSNPLASAFDGINHGLTRSAILGAVASNTTSCLSLGDASFTNGDVSRLGYSVLGPMFFGFAKWILDQSRADGIDDLYFLSRDGEIAKRCYDILADGIKDAPRSNYVFASRRAIRVAGLFNKEDIQHVLKANFTPMPLQDLLWNRFGISSDEIVPEVFDDYDFKGAEAIADWRVAESRIQAFFSDYRVVDIILKNAEKEREMLSHHYKTAGMKASQRIAFVDIGHSGTLQAGIARIMNIQQSRGYYFATVADVDEVVGKGHTAIGYIADRIVNKGNNHSYIRNTLMFEVVFLNAQNSFVKFVDDGGKHVPIFLSEEEVDGRKVFSSKLHDAVCEFCRDLVASFKPYIDLFEMTGREAAAGYEAFLTSAKKSDAILFSGIRFENYYSGRSSRWILPPVSSVHSEAAIWKYGRAVLIGEKPIDIPVGWRAHVHTIISHIVLKGPERLARKFQKSPQDYFADSKSRIARFVGKVVYREPNGTH